MAYMDNNVFNISPLHITSKMVKLDTGLHPDSGFNTKLWNKKKENQASP